MANIRRLVLDVLKPHEPDIIAVSQALATLDGVSAVNIAIYEIDRRVENAKITIVGEAIVPETVRETIADLGGTVHSIDEVVAGEMVIEAIATPQD